MLKLVKLILCENNSTTFKMILISLALLIDINVANAIEEKQDKEEVYAIALSFNGAEPFPSMLGITPQVRFSHWFRFSAGWGYANKDGGTGSTVGVSAKFIPYSFDYPNNVSIRPLIGIGAANYSSNNLVLYGVAPNTTVYSFDFGVELKSQSIFDFGLGYTVPVNTGVSLPYARITIRLLKD
jgi:hypothetical protein